jgi:DNA-binding CsgD family transcriptional regulator
MPAVQWPCPHCGVGLVVSLDAVPQQAVLYPRLTPRERDVLRRVAAGETTAQIAAALGVRRGTVAWHLSQAFARLSVRSRAEAIYVAVHLGLLTQP